MRNRSARLYERAQDLLPGGVNSPVRAFRAVGGEPFFVDRAAGARLFDVDGNAYVDYVLSWGALILGHADDRLVQAIQAAAARGTSYGAPCEPEVELATLIAATMPGLEMLRFVNSGSEATMSAVRLARGVTGRDRILKFAGCYHGHGDSFLVAAGSGVATLGLPDSPGVPAPLAALTMTAPFNDLTAVEEAFRLYGDEIACVIVEPVAGNAGLIRPVDGFLAGLRRLTREHGALLVFDEVMTGFRVALGGAQARWGVRPDLTTLGKIIGGGLPVGAYGGRAELMRRVAPTGPVYQAGTLSGNPLAMAAGTAQLAVLREDEPYDALEDKGRILVDGITDAADSLGIPVWGRAIGAMWGVHFTDGPVHTFEDARRADTALFSRFFNACLQRGVYIAPSPFEAAFVSTAHGDAEIEFTIDHMRAALREAAG